MNFLQGKFNRFYKNFLSINENNLQLTNLVNQNFKFLTLCLGNDGCLNLNGDIFLLRNRAINKKINSKEITKYIKFLSIIIEFPIFSYSSQ